ncbi:cytochrome P450 [Pyrenochaeta sp. MPI-SDFR-AT-0127]|nr:cytochrome P450 [Pyrenochaeta sp. MPI-SDFR-AT-0127]
MAQNFVFYAPLALVFLGVYRFLLYPAFFGPLAKIPRLHITSPFSRAYLLWIQYSGKENAFVHEQHKRKGPILLLAPDVLSLNCFEGGLKQIYTGGFPKSEFYVKGFHNYGVLPLFAKTNNQEHAQRKRMFSNVFSKSSIMSSPSAREVTKAVLHERLLPLFDNAATKDAPVNVVPLNYAYSMDSFVNFQFGLAQGCNLIENLDERKMYLDGFFDRERYSFAAVEFPKIVSFFQKIGIQLIPKFVDDGTRNIENWNLKMCDKAEQVIRDQVELSPRDWPTVFAQALQQMGKPGAKTMTGLKNEKYTNRTDIACEMFSDSSAAHQTSGATLTYLMYELSNRPDVQDKLRKELMSLDPPLLLRKSKDDSIKLPNAKDVLELPFLDAVIMETLRLYPSVPGGQPRVTPNTTNSLGGFDGIPAGVTVQSYAYALHRNPDVFPEPEVWSPQRWIEASPEQLIEMRRWFWAFGSGGSMCIGSNFALYSMKYGTASLYTNFTTSVYSKGDMELIDAYLSGPKGGKLELKFRRV